MHPTLHTNRINNRLIAETVAVFILISIVSVLLHKMGTTWFLHLPLLLFQGLWFYRFYIVGHEAAHKKLFPGNPAKNDFWGCVILLPLLTPINIYRKIHAFHHGFNRKDHHTSALDTFVTSRKPTFFVKFYYYVLWYISTFLGGLFIHSLVSVILFLFVPPAWSIKISPAFAGWKAKDQLTAILIFLAGLAFHLSVYLLGGKEVYLYTLGFPMLAFAWILSLLVYIFHYDTTTGDQVRYNVRSLRHVPVFSWVLMNFNEHATHHQYPNIPWYELPDKRKPLPEAYALRNQTTWSLVKAIFNQLKGPTIVYKHDPAKRPPL